MSISASNLIHRSPFVLLPAESGLLSTLQPESRNALDHLGQCDAGELYFNREVASLGLICGGSKRDLDITVGRLVASHLSEPDTHVLILCADGSTINPEPCPLAAWGKRESVVLVSPRNVQSTSSLYTSTGVTTVPLRFDEGSVMMQHILSFFTPPLDMDERDSILNTVQLVISQLADSFDLQRFTELVEKENWTRAGENFMALRQSILRTLLSSRPCISFPSMRQTIVDIRDPTPNSTGIDTVLLDMAFHQWLRRYSGRRLVVFYNACGRLHSGSPLLHSLESLAALGCDRPTSIIFATTSPLAVPLYLFNTVDYLIGGLFRSSMWQSLLQDHFSINFPSLDRASGRQVVWSPESRTYRGSDYEDAREPSYWADDCLVVALEEFSRTMPMLPERLSASLEFSTNSDASVTTAHFGGSAGVCKPSLPSDSFQLDEEEGMVPVNQLVMNGGQYIDTFHENGETAELGTSQETTGSIPFQDLAQEQPPASQISNYPDIFRPLLSGILMLRSSEDDGWVNFEDLRKIVGDKDTLKRLGWNTYTSFVNKAREQKLIELRMQGKKAKLLRILPIKMWEDRIRPLTASALLLDSCPTGFGPRPLVEAILQISGGDIEGKVTREELANVFIKTKEELGTSKFKGPAFEQLLKWACEGGWTQQGKFNGHKCIWLGPKVSPESLGR